jgi:hypothetical protein
VQVSIPARVIASLRKRSLPNNERVSGLAIGSFKAAIFVFSRNEKMASRGAVLIMLSAVVMQAEGFQVIVPEIRRAAAGVLLPLPCRSAAGFPVAPRSLRTAVLSMAASDGILIVGGGPR